MSRNRQRKRPSLRKLSRDERKRNAKRWMSQQRLPKDLLSAYVKRYDIPRTEAHIELLELGYGEILTIYAYEQDGIEWEYKVEPLSGDMLVVPKGTPEWELPQYW